MSGPFLHDPRLTEVAAWHPVDGTPAKRRVALGSSIGATIETYDFIGFGTAAALYFGTVFFPESDPLSGTLLSFATLGIGFAVRPLGGIVGGIPRRPDRTQARPRRVAAAHGHRDRAHRPAARPTSRSASGRRSCSSLSAWCRAWRSAPSGAAPSS